MTTIKAVEHLTLDGVMQEPESWSPPYQDHVMADTMQKDLNVPGGMLLGRRTYEILHAAWAGRDDNPFTPVFESRRKYVVSRTLSEPLVWGQSTLVAGDLSEFKQAVPEDRLVVLGSGELVRGLLREGLLDELLLAIHPLVLGTGARLFEDGGPRVELAVDGPVTTTTGVAIGTYRPVSPP